MLGDKNATKSDVDAIQASINSLKEERSEKTADQSLPGYSINMLVTVFANPNNRRGFIFDMGRSLTEDRISLYTDIANNLCFRIIDSDGESHTLKVPRAIDRFALGNALYLSCEYGFSDTHSFIALNINGRQEARKDMRSPLQLSANLNRAVYKIASDLEGRNGAGLLISELIVLPNTLNTASKIKFLESYR